MKLNTTIWFTGLPCSGKTTIAKELHKTLRSRGYKVEHFDGDNLRNTLNKDLGFSKEDRDENIRRVIYLCKLLNKHNIIVLSSFISPYRKIRNNARKEIDNFVEVFVDCPIDVCIKRDTKGMYKKAMNGEITNFTGIDAPYEEPKNPDLVLKTNECSIDECVKKILDKIGVK